MKFAFQHPRFVATAATPEQLSSFGSMPHIALIGRSNVGKSSLLNHLFKTKDLVRSSSTPGKTQAIHFFMTDNRLLFADLPGYGYAKAPPDVRARWSELITAYLEMPPQLLLLLLDIRHPPHEQDLTMLEWIAAARLPFLLVLTKVDKVTVTARAQQKAHILRALEETYSRFVPQKPLPDPIYYSSVTEEGRLPLLHQLQEALS